MIRLFGRSRIMQGDEMLQVLREGGIGPVVYKNGKLVKRQPACFTILANVQNLKGQDLLLVPEADRYSGGFKLYSPKLAKRPSLQTNDKVLREDTVYQVQVCNDWGSYSEATIIEQDVGPDIAGLFAPIDPSIQKELIACLR